jgi:HPt (histidine-containing phosphotransfer) domain-containing protein
MQTSLNRDALLDAGRIEEITSMSPELMVEIAAIYLGKVPERLSAMESGIEAGDAESVSEAAHSLKGSSGNVGATAMGVLAARIDELAKDGRLSAAAPLVRELHGVFAATAGLLPHD